MALAKHIETGKAYAGLLIDGVAGTPYVVATLTLTEETGLLVELPYTTAKDAHQFREVARWFDARRLPEAFQFRGDDLEVTLYGCRMSGRTRHFSRDLAVGRFIADSAVIGLRSVDAPFDVESVRSRIDGLREWTGFTATEVEHDVDDHGILQGLTIHVRSTSELIWRHGDATMKISTDWEGMEGETGAHIDEWVTISSSFDPPRPPAAHVEAQEAIRDLLVLSFGTSVRFRRHAVRDSSMPSPRQEASDPVHLPHRELLIRGTTLEHFQPAVFERALRRPIGWAGDYSVEALEAWSDLHVRFARAINPLVSLINRDWFTADDVVLSANISLEAIGHLLGPVPGEEETYRNPAKPITATTSTRVLRALRALPVDWTSVGYTELGLARLIANTYNSIKHFDRVPLADEDLVHVVADISQLVARLSILAQLPNADDVVPSYCEEYRFIAVMSGFKRLQVRVTDEGYLLPEEPDENPQSVADGHEGMDATA